MNLYKLHTKPEQLISGTDKNRKILHFVAAIKNYKTSHDEFFEHNVVEDMKAELGTRRYPDIEKAILNMRMDGIFLMMLYAEVIIGGRWVLAEEFITQDDGAWEDYRLEHNLKK